MDWYAKRYGNFTYYEDWAGFNVPSTAMQPFYEGKFDPLSEKERQLLQLFEGTLSERFYVIGVYDLWRKRQHDPRARARAVLHRRGLSEGRAQGDARLRHDENFPGRSPK